ncbi:TorF family putative porin [Stenotrophomonas sp. GD04145]|uniref:TorF family putative porin n=1 Tax=Stenotrophomonas sp. GD04145 TaxID=2975436 RepID=UPI00244B5867|nr:TorF family putative porin [Stenotrophomonas sp. GD04145]MDH0171500.1 TorF family putative porin [Stenotrophomonas sp. GD04145]
MDSKGMIAALAAALAGLLGVGSAQAQVSGNATLTSDYVWRGSSQSDGDPAVQAGAKFALASGWYASAWGSNVSFKPDNGARSEFDLVAGWSGTPAADWTLDANLTRYVYPGTARALDWTEFAATVGWKQRTWLQVAHSSDALAGGRRGTYAQLGVRLPLRESFRLEAAVGHYWLAAAQGPDYVHGQLSAIATLAPAWEVRATVHDTDTAARRLFPGNAGGRWELALQGSF